MKNSGRTYARRAALIAACAAPLACGESAPEEPTWAEDVRPILMANCASCHSFPPIEGAPATPLFRLDVYGDTTLDEGTELAGDDVGGETVQGAGAMSARIVDRAVDQENMPPPLPGTGELRPLSSRQQEILERWHEQGAERGPPAPGNRPPEMDLRTPLEDSFENNLLVVEYEIRDPDFDYVTGELAAEPEDGGDAEVVTYNLHSGRGQASWEVSGREGERYELVATLHDGSESVELSLGEVDIPPE